jgi:N-acetylglucosaminyldiphosphoundecaprenol N-acetyl-beta-D-mannosaminyltransferase
MINFQSYNILGIRVDAVDMETALAQMEEFIKSRKPHLVVTADASGVVMAQTDPELHRIMNSADLVTPDSTGILWAAKQLGYSLPQRVSGVDIVDLLCGRAAAGGYSVFLLGSAPGVVDAAAGELKRRYPGLNIAGCHHGYFKPEESNSIAQMVRDAKPDILFVAFGIPRQEKWITRYKREMNVPVSIGVGGTFDVISGNVKRAPVWMQRRGLEWLHRLIMNPRKYKKCLTLPVFMAMVKKAKRRMQG